MTEEEECYEEVQNEPLLQEKCASAYSGYIECPCALSDTQPQFTQCL